MSEWVVVKVAACQHTPSSEFVCEFPPLEERCFGCRGDGSRLDVSSAIPVEPGDLFDGDTINAWPHGRGVKAFVPLESSSSGEGGDQWPEATGASAAEREEVAPSEPALLVAEAPEGTQPPGLSDRDER